MRDFDENLISITECQVLSKLPDLFTMEDGTAVTTPQQWQLRRKELYRQAVELQYGIMPPKPEFLEVEPIDDHYQGLRCYRITTGTIEKPLCFYMRVIGPEKSGVFPAIVDGDLCWKYPLDPDFIQAVTDQDVMLVLFNRLELAADRKDCNRKGPIYNTYPGYNFSALGAWAWGYARCVDALEKLGIVDMDNIAFTGHSRGGKTALLAGVLDERAAVVNPNESGAGGAGCYRVHMNGIREDGGEERSEMLSDLVRAFPHWFGLDMPAYVEKEGELPFDEHFLKAMVAPRVYVETDAASDLWANPVGSHQTALAAREAFKFLGCEENCRLYFRKGTHYHKAEDIGLLARILRQRMAGEPMEEGSFQLPFKPIEPIFDWVCPNTERR